MSLPSAMACAISTMSRAEIRDHYGWAEGHYDAAPQLVAEAVQRGTGPGLRGHRRGAGQRADHGIGSCVAVVTAYASSSWPPKAGFPRSTRTGTSPTRVVSRRTSPATRPCSGVPRHTSTRSSSAERGARRAADQVRAGHQSQDRHGARPHHPAIDPAPRRSGDGMTTLYPAANVHPRPRRVDSTLVIFCRST